MNALQKFSKRLVEGRASPPGIAPARQFDPPMPRPQDWLSRLGEVARRLPSRDATPRPPAAASQAVSRDS